MKLNRGDYFYVETSSALGNTLGREPKRYYFRVLRTVKYRPRPGGYLCHMDIIEPLPISVDAILLQDWQFGPKALTRLRVTVRSNDRIVRIDGLGVAYHIDRIAHATEAEVRRLRLLARSTFLAAIESAQELLKKHDELNEEIFSAGTAFDNLEKRTRSDFLKNRRSKAA